VTQNLRMHEIKTIFKQRLDHMIMWFTT
jgi:hypothetical protein